MITTVSLVTICHHTKITLFIDYSPHTVHFTHVAHLICNWKFALLISLSYFSLFLICLLSGKTSLFSVSKTLFLFYYICFFFSKIICISKVIQYLSFSNCLFSLNIIPSRFFHITSGNILFFSRAE